MADLVGRKVFKVFNQDFIVDERYTVTKELGQGAYGIVWYIITYAFCSRHTLTLFSTVLRPMAIPMRALRSRRSPMSSARRS
jgi:mitogen-activated protein kinase 7